MTIPKQLKVGPFLYTISRPDMINRFVPENDGACNYAQLEIMIEDGLEPARADETFLHELLHAVDEFMCINLDETQVGRLSKGLLMVLKDNNLLAD